MMKRSIIILAVFVGLPQANTVWGVDGKLSGNGFERSPYLIEDLKDFDTFTDPENADIYWARGVHVKLVNDVELSKRTYKGTATNSSKDTRFKEYEGLFDGNLKVIRNWTFNANSIGKSYIGIFGVIGNEGKVSNLGIENINIVCGKESRYVGGLCGKNKGRIINCYTTGIVTSKASGKSLEIGGFCGRNEGAIIKCYSEVSVTGDSAIGSLCGRNYYGSITQCFSTGKVVGRKEAIGGLCGRNLYGWITSCYSTGEVSSEFNIKMSSTGGLCGLNYEGFITNCYSTGLISVGENSKHLGGLCGQNYGSSGIITGCIWDVESSKLTKSAGGLGLATKQMKRSFTYGAQGWGGETWTIDEGNSYPHLVWENKRGKLILIPPVDLSGSGTAKYPFLINDLEDFYIFIDPANWASCWSIESHIKLMCDIQLTDQNFKSALIAPHTEGRKIWEFRGVTFNGVFEGNGHVVRNLVINADRKNNRYLGLFGRIGFSGKINNLGIENGLIHGEEDPHFVGALCGENCGVIRNCYTMEVTIKGKSRLGGLCGINQGIQKHTNRTWKDIYKDGGWKKGIITNCYSTDSVYGSEFVGGLCGSNNCGTIENCFSSCICKILATNQWSRYHGGLIGHNYSSIIAISYSTGFINGDRTTGGFCGINAYSKIENCYSMGAVKGRELVGGFCGYNTSSTIKNCYSIGKVSGKRNLGGFCPITCDKISGCFWDIKNSGMANDGNAIGKNTAEMLILDTYLTEGWDFVGETANGTKDIWWFKDDGTEYPKLAWQLLGNGKGSRASELDDIDVIIMPEGR